MTQQSQVAIEFEGVCHLAGLQGRVSLVVLVCLMGSVGYSYGETFRTPDLPPACELTVQLAPSSVSVVSRITGPSVSDGSYSMKVLKQDSAGRSETKQSGAVSTNAVGEASLVPPVISLRRKGWIEAELQVRFGDQTATCEARFKR
jgi:hypothetical protein